MQGIIDWIRKHYHWLVLLLLEGVSLALLVSFNGYQGSVWFTSANHVIGKVLEWENKGMAYLSMGERNRELTEKNILLERELEVLRNEINELKHDSSYTERTLAAKLREVPTLQGHIVSNNVAVRDNYITIDKGTKDGVRVKMGVVSGNGIVGIVYQTTKNYSVVMSILNSKSAVSCRIRGTNFFGYLRWNGGNTLCATLDDVPRHARFKIGDAVETSGFSNVFPPGIFVGRIIHIKDSRDGLSFQLTVQLASDLANIRNVAIILNDHDSHITP